MARVPEHAYRVLRDIDFELPVPAAVHEMYERMDGTGYPRHLVGEAISVHARVLAVVNAFKIFKEVYFIGGAYPAESIYTLQHYMNNKFAKLDYQDVTTAAYSFAVIVIALFLLLYRTKSVRQGETA